MPSISSKPSGRGTTASVEGVDPDAMRVLLRYRWPGNVRELEHVIERAVIVAEGPNVTVDDLSPVVKTTDRQPSSSTFTIPPHHTLAEIEKLAILQTLERTSWNKRKAAHILGVYRPTLYSKLRKYHLSDGPNGICAREGRRRGPLRQCRGPMKRRRRGESERDMAASRPGIGEEYLSQVAHELRGSLNAILGWAEFLRRTDCDEPGRVRAAETIIRHARQQTAMLSELLDTWRLASGTLALNVSPFALKPLVDSAIDAVQPAAQARSVHVECHDETDGLGRARGDPRRLAQALVALLANAVHFAPEDSTVEVSIAVDDGAARVVIRDGGPPVPPAALPYLFDRNRPPERMSPRGSFRLDSGSRVT